MLSLARKRKTKVVETGSTHRRRLSVIRRAVKTKGIKMLFKQMFKSLLVSRRQLFMSTLTERRLLHRICFQSLEFQYIIALKEE